MSGRVVNLAIFTTFHTKLSHENVRKLYFKRELASIRDSSCVLISEFIRLISM